MRKQHWLYSLSMATSIVLMLIPAHEALAQSDVSVEIVQGTTRVQAGDRVSFTVRVTNNGPAPANFVQLFGGVSSQLIITRNSCGNISQPNNCFIGFLPAGESRTITYEGEVCCFTRGASRRATFRVEVPPSGGYVDPNRGNNVATIGIQISGPAQ